MYNIGSMEGSDDRWQYPTDIIFIYHWKKYTTTLYSIALMTSCMYIIYRGLAAYVTINYVLCPSIILVPIELYTV